MDPRVAVVVGSLRSQSWSRKLADEIIRDVSPGFYEGTESKPE